MRAVNLLPQKERRTPGIAGAKAMTLTASRDSSVRIRSCRQRRSKSSAAGLT